MMLPDPSAIMDAAREAVTGALSHPGAVAEKLWDLVTVRGVANLAAVWVTYRAAIALYNISPFHPLYRFPGPRLARMSYLYEAYYDWILVGRYGKEIKRMHDKYGAFAENRVVRERRANISRPHREDQPRRAALLRSVLHR